ncbi:MAG: pyrroline-5-carboxylate reductase [Peptostreptococcaceae bacterium]|nr:pyrroline-5-carboxylate reductase [Peptostreptococcaceae bacterium]
METKHQEITKKIGFIGCGNMAKAMIGGMLKSGLVKAGNIIAGAKTKQSLEKAKQEFALDIKNQNHTIQTTLDNKEVVQKSDIIFVAVKPHLYDNVLQSVMEEGKGKIFVSIAPGKSIAHLENLMGAQAKILRAMPNTPALVGEGVTAICRNANIDDEEYSILKQLLSSFGTVEEIEERLFDAVISVAGSSPAYVFMFIEAMADAAVLQGMPRAQAYRLASQAVLGSAKMVLASGKHPAELKDAVCSPGGTTIEGVAMLEETGMRSSVIQAMNAVYEKSRKM